MIYEQTYNDKTMTIWNIPVEILERSQIPSKPWKDFRDRLGADVSICSL